jgi:hypothetical protein
MLLVYRKHFPYEDYDEWLFGESGLWNGTTRHPEILVIHLGLHTCVHAWHSPENQNTTMIAQHKRDLKTLMKAVRTAVDRTPPHMPRTQVLHSINVNGEHYAHLLGRLPSIGMLLLTALVRIPATIPQGHLLELTVILAVVFLSVTGDYPVSRSGG